MDKKLKAKWVRALRSGKYKQGPFYLHSTAKDTYCCLGVLGKVLRKSDKVLADNKSMITPKDWGVLSTNAIDDLVRMNDSTNDPKTFAEIADYIEATL